MEDTKTVTDEAESAFVDAYMTEVVSRVPTASLPSHAAVRAGLEAASPFLAPRPVVDRGALAQAVAGHTRSEMYRGSEPEWWCPCGNWRTHDINEAVYGHARHVADLVLDLLNGVPDAPRGV